MEEFPKCKKKLDLTCQQNKTEQKCTNESMM
jgi:hypothetical protein